MIQEINLYSSNSVLKDVHPIEKIIFVLISLIVCAKTEKSLIIAINIILFIAMNFIFKNPIKIIKKFLIIALIFSFWTILALILQKSSLNEIMVVCLRMINGAISISFLALTTSINSMVNILYKWEWTRDIGDIIKSMEKFIIIISNDFNRIKIGMKCRGGFYNFKSSILSLGKALALTFKLVLNRWKETSLSLKNRCYTGKMNYTNNFKISKRNIVLNLLYLVIMCVGM